MVSDNEECRIYTATTMTTSTHLHEKKTNVTLFIGSAFITILFIIQFPELLQLRKQAGSQEDVYVAINV